MILFEIYKPKPKPDSDLVANLVNSRGSISESIPVPLSFILTTTHILLLLLLSLSPVPISFFAHLSTCMDIIILPLFLVELIALVSKLEMTSYNLTLSAFTSKAVSGLLNTISVLFTFFAFTTRVCNISLITSHIFSTKSNRSLFNFSELLSILATSKISFVSL